MTEEHRRRLAWCEGEQDWLRDLIETLVRLESPSTCRAAVEKCGAELSARLERCGAAVERIAAGDRGDHIRAVFDSGGRTGQILVLGHFDTVWPVGQLERMPLRAADGRLFGPGVFDMKAGIGVALLAMRALREQVLAGPEGPAPPVPHVVMIWTSDEEVGSGTSRALIEQEALRSDAVLVLEPSLPGGGAKTARRGVGAFELVLHGVAAHAGLDPEKGASAIHELAAQILRVIALQDLEHGVSVNVGTIRGGSRPNVVAGDASASIDVRVPTRREAARLESRIRALSPIDSRTTIELRGGFERPPLERTEGVARLYGLAREVALALGRDLPEGSAGGGSDGNFTAALGVPTLDGLGPQGDGAHALHEHVLLADLPWRAALLAGLLRRLGGEPSGNTRETIK